MYFSERWSKDDNEDDEYQVDVDGKVSLLAAHGLLTESINPLHIELWSPLGP